jgi:hypothetical protein
MIETKVLSVEAKGKPKPSRPPLERALHDAACELEQDAATLASIGESVFCDLHRGQQYVMLRGLADLGRRLNKLTHYLYETSDHNTKRNGR